MRGGDGIITSVSPVYGQGLYRPIFTQESQGVVDRCFGECRDGRRKSYIDFVYRGMRAMRHQVFHNGYPLYGRLDVVALQSF